MKKRFLIITLLLSSFTFFSIMLISCVTEQPKYKPKPYYYFKEEQFNENYQKWKDLNISDYSFVWEIYGATPNVTIYGSVTRRGEEFSVEITYDEEHYRDERMKKRIPKEGDATFMTSIDDAFNLIKSTYATRKELFDKGELFSVTASANYDKQYFFPEYASVDSEEEWDYEEISDGVYVAPDGKRPELSFGITKFEVLE